MGKPISRIEAWEYRGRRLLVMPSGTTLIFKPGEMIDPETPAQNRLIHEAASLTSAMRWVDGD